MYRARIFIDIVDFHFQCVDVDDKVFDILIVRVHFIVDVKTYSLIFVEFIK